MRYAIVLFLAVLVGCSSKTEGGDAGSDAATESGGGDAMTGSDSGTLLAPVIVSAEPLGAGLHVMWTNTQKDCDAIEGERKSTTEAYKVVFTIPDGTVDNKHDEPLMSGTMYTYRLRCKKGMAYSPYSNEKSNTAP